MSSHPHFPARLCLAVAALLVGGLSALLILMLPAPAHAVPPEPAPTMGEGGTTAEAEAILARYHRLQPNTEIYQGDATSADPPAEPMLVVNKIAPATVAAGATLTYTIFYTNSSDHAINNVYLEDGLGANQVYCQSDLNCRFTSGGTAPPPTFVGRSQNSFQWSLGNLPPGSVGAITFTVGVTTAVYPQTGRAPTVLGNTARLRIGGPTGAMGNSDETGTLVTGPVLVLTKRAAPDRPIPGETYTYTIMVGNATAPGDSIAGRLREDARPATNITIEEDLPWNVYFVAAGQGGAYVTTTKRVFWSVPGPLNPGMTTTLTLAVQVNPNVNDCGIVFNNNYFVTSEQVPINPDSGVPYMVRGESNETGIQAPIALRLNVEPDEIMVEKDVTYTLTIRNYTRTMVLGDVTVDFPDSFSFERANPSATEVQPGQKVVFRSVTLPAGTVTNPAMVTLTLQTNVGRAWGTLYSIATINVPASIPSGCIGWNVRGLNIDPKVVINKTANTREERAGGEVDYTIQIANLGDTVVNNITLTDTLPDRSDDLYEPFSYLRMVSGPQPVSTSSRSVIWSGLSVGPHGVYTMTFAAMPRGVPTYFYCNNASGSSPDAGIKPSQDEACIRIAPPIALEKTVDRPVVQVNGEVVFTIRFEALDGDNWHVWPQDILAPFTFVSMVTGPAPMTITNGVVQWPDRILNRTDGEVTYSFRAKAPSIGGEFWDEARLYAEDPMDKAVKWYNYWRISVIVSKLEVALLKTADHDDRQDLQNPGNPAGLGDLIVYTLWVQNRSALDTATGIVLTDTLPPGFTFVRMAEHEPPRPDPQITPLPDGRQLLQWPAFSVLPNRTEQYPFIARAPSFINAYVNETWASGPPEIGFVCWDADRPGCVRDAQGHYVNMTQRLRVENRISASASVTPTQIEPGKVTEYKVTLLNVNSHDYTATTVTATLPVGFEFKEIVSGPAPTVERNAQGLQELVWTNQRIAAISDTKTPGQIQFRFRAQAPRTYGLFTMRVAADSPDGLIPTADKTGLVTISAGRPTLGKAVSTELAERGVSVTFQISLVNPDPAPLTGVVITDALPAGFTFLSAKDSPAPQVNGSTLTWPNLTVPGTISDTLSGLQLTFLARVPTADGLYTNRATASGSRLIDQSLNEAAVRVGRIRFIFLPWARKGAK